MFGFGLLSHSRRHPIQLLPGAFHLTLRLFALLVVHLRQGFGHSPAGSTQDGSGHLQIPPQLLHRRFRLWPRRVLRLQKQRRLGENAFPHYPRSFAPGTIELFGLS